VAVARLSRNGFNILAAGSISHLYPADQLSQKQDGLIQGNAGFATKLAASVVFYNSDFQVASCQVEPLICIVSANRT
jgi:hypothetical protein